MKLRMVGCSHHHSTVKTRELLAFSPPQARSALELLRRQFPNSEAVLLSTCNRTELYIATKVDNGCPTHNEVIDFFADFHGLRPGSFATELLERCDEEAVRHLFKTAGSLDSMVVGEAQILSQVKQAYDMATEGDATGPLTHAAFQKAIRVAKRVATETALHKRRVSIPSVAVCDYAHQFFERFDDKKILVIGAGEMGEETLQYLLAENAKHITIVNRNPGKAKQLAEQSSGVAKPWDTLHECLVEADLVVSTTGATDPIVRVDDYRTISEERFQRPLFILDLAIPRDFEQEIGDFLGVYLYSIDDLQEACNRNLKSRQKELPKAQRIVEEETASFMKEWHHRTTGPWIKQLRTQANELKAAEFKRLANKLNECEEKTLEEIEKSFDRLVNKILHPPLESLRDEAAKGTPHGLLDAMKRLFNLNND